MNAQDRKVALAHFARAGDPERGDALWGCGNGHEHHTRAAANKCGTARLVWLSDAMVTHIKEAAAFEPRYMTVYAGAGDLKEGEVVLA